jgi:hypothetical protein
MMSCNDRISGSSPWAARNIGALLACVGCLFADASFAAPPGKDDYASGMSVSSADARPLIEAVLPDEVYRVITREDLGDLRVFNGDGVPVPHAFCPAPQSGEAQVTEQSLQVFVLSGRNRGRQDSRVNVQTASGTRVDVQDASPSEPEVVSGLVHIIDARDTLPLRAIRFDWHSPDGASEVKVRIEASEDLDRWRTVVPASTLLLARQGGAELRRERIQLPQQQYSYLRVQRTDGGPPLSINSVTAERVSEAEAIEPVWFTATRLRFDEEDGLIFDAGHIAPVSYARVRLQQDNSRASVVVQSRPDEESPWRDRWRGERYLIVSDTVRRESPPASFQATHDRYWRVQILKDAHVYRDSTLELGYRPARLRFLAQGPGPFTVAFGSRRAEVAQPASCDGLLADVSAAERERMIGPGYVGPVVSLGGEQALRPPPRQTPVKVMILWAVLVVGVALLVGMALSLLKRVRQPLN